jgi:hypothetical protein
MWPWAATIREKINTRKADRLMESLLQLGQAA